MNFEILIMLMFKVHWSFDITCKFIKKEKRK